MKQIKVYRGVDLLEKILEFIAMTPNEKQWNFKSLNDNKPRQIRLLQINSLLKAFSIIEGEKNILEKTQNYSNLDLTSEINSILNGDFIKNKEIEDFNELIDFAIQFRKQDSKQERIIPIRIGELSFIYPKMIRYKIKLREIIDFNSGWLETSGTFTMFHIHLTNSISSNLINKYDDLDKTIELFLNPSNRIFTEMELIEKFNFPTENLDQIDMDNY
jgi:hypothetical protein